MSAHVQIAGECDARGCSNRKPAGVTLCRSCWYLLPKSLRSKLWRALGTPDADTVRNECIDKAEQRINGKLGQGAIA